MGTEDLRALGARQKEGMQLPAVIVELPKLPAPKRLDADGSEYAVSRFSDYLQTLEQGANELTNSPREWLTAMKMLCDYAVQFVGPARKARPIRSMGEEPETRDRDERLPDLSGKSDEEIERLAKEGE